MYLTNPFRFIRVVIFVEPVSMSREVYLSSVVPIGVGLRKEAYKDDTMFKMFSISMGVVVATCSEARFDIWALFYSLVLLLSKRRDWLWFKSCLHPKDFIESDYVVVLCCTLLFGFLVCSLDPCGVSLFRFRFRVMILMMLLVVMMMKLRVED